MSLTVWDISLTRDTGGERWKWPKVQGPRRDRLEYSTRIGVRVGWRMTAWGLHVGRTFVSDDQFPDVLAERRASCPACGHRGRVDGSGVVVPHPCHRPIPEGRAEPIS